MTTAEAHAEVLAELADLLSAELVGTASLGAEATASGFVSGYELFVRTDDGSDQRHVVYLESKPPEAERPGVLRFSADDGGDVIDAWLYPNDPELPALGAAVFPDAAAILLGRLGFPMPPPSLELLAYRPGKRAVLRAVSADLEVYLKVVRPRRAERIAAAHARWTAAGVSAPRSLGWSPEGLLVLEALPGEDLDAALLDETGRRELLEGIERLSSLISAIPSDTTARRSLLARVGWYAARLSSLRPDWAVSVDALRRRAERAHASAAPPAPCTIHGDLHLGQFRVDPEHPQRIVGLLDIDTAGTGDPADDAAALFAHAITTAVFSRERGDAERARSWALLAEEWAARWDVRGPDFALRARAIATAHLLAHALTTPQLADALLDFAESVVDESALIAVSPRSHAASRE